MKKTWLKWVQFIFTLWTRRDSFSFFVSETFEANMAIFWGLLSSLQTWRNSLKSSHKPLGWFFKWLTSLMYYYYVYITMIVYFLTDVMKWLRGKWNQLMKLVIPVWSSIGQDFCVPSMHNREFKFGYQHFLLCQKSFLKVSSKWLLKNKSDNGKLLLGKTYSGERFRAILALLFWIIWILFIKNFIHVKCNITKKLSFLGLKFGIVKPLQSINYKL